jgi:hypothetical protein
MKQLKIRAQVGKEGRKPAFLSIVAAKNVTAFFN